MGFTSYRPSGSPWASGTAEAQSYAVTVHPNPCWLHVARLPCWHRDRVAWREASSPCRLQHNTASRFSSDVTWGRRGAVGAGSCLQQTPFKSEWRLHLFEMSPPPVVLPSGGFQKTAQATPLTGAASASVCRRTSLLPGKELAPKPFSEQHKAFSFALLFALSPTHFHLFSKCCFFPWSHRFLKCKFTSKPVKCFGSVYPSFMPPPVTLKWTMCLTPGNPKKTDVCLSATSLSGLFKAPKQPTFMQMEIPASLFSLGCGFSPGIYLLIYSAKKTSNL